ncbi:MAG: ribonucleotide-diphosphate reductase subunit beta [Solirubrobacterales bacterium]|nr:ribonucleotide-diphosphate reductase subunit beta [Solirubrobacterales bacterium]
MAELEIQLNDPQTLYRRWEDSQWNPFTVDLGRDQEQWAEMREGDRGLIYWVLSSLMVAEERITTKFSGLVGAHGSEEEASFLATQQVDEARHMQFYARFQDEVIADPATVAAHVERSRAQVSPAFRQIFDVELVSAHERLVANPDDLASKVRFVTLYHLILEGTLGLTTFRFVTDYLKEHRMLPGFVDGYSKIHHDETRHIGYGVWFLREAVKESPGVAPDSIREMLRTLLPSVAESLSPSSEPDGPDLDALGVSGEEIRDFALGGLTRRLEIVGVPLETVF